jgi:hypothetical protein
MRGSIGPRRGARRGNPSRSSRAGGVTDAPGLVAALAVALVASDFQPARLTRGDAPPPAPQVVGWEQAVLRARVSARGTVDHVHTIGGTQPLASRLQRAIREWRFRAATGERLQRQRGSSGQELALSAGTTGRPGGARLRLPRVRIPATRPWGGAALKRSGTCPRRTPPCSTPAAATPLQPTPARVTSPLPTERRASRDPPIGVLYGRRSEAAPRRLLEPGAC